MLVGCDGNDGDDGFSCPACDDNVTINSYGTFEFEKEGDDSTARRIVSECGWHVQGGHNGGIGNTLQVASCGNEGVIFVWAFNDFHAFRVAAGWEGQTEQGTRIGDTLETFLVANSNFTQASPSSYVLQDDDGTIRVRANFTDDGVLEELIVGSFFRR
jgi:hypothetical protein